jgi:hypothetical protein
MEGNPATPPAGRDDECGPRIAPLLVALCLAAALAVSRNLLHLVLFLAHRIPREDGVTYQDAGRALAGWLAGSRPAPQ